MAARQELVRDAEVLIHGRRRALGIARADRLDDRRMGRVLFLRGVRNGRDQRPSASVCARPQPASGCQASTTASGTGSPAPSSTRPASVRAPPGTSRGAIPMEKNGPTLARNQKQADALRRFRSEAEEVLELKKK